MKILFTTFIAVVFSLGAVSAQDAEFVDGPKIQFEKTTHDFGANPQGTPVSCEFIFKNVGTEPLVLQNVKASCGCTTPFWPKEPIMPGQESKIEAKYNMARAGNFSKTITVTVKPKAEGETPEVIRLIIKGKAEAATPENTVDEAQPNIITNPNLDD